MSGNKLPPCAPDCFNGPVILISHTVPPASCERWVKRLATFSRERVDWHYAGGRIIVRTARERAFRRLARSLKKMKPSWEALYYDASNELLGERPRKGYFPWKALEWDKKRGQNPRRDLIRRKHKRRRQRRGW